MELSGLKIGQVTLENPLILAPMAGVTDLPFRLLCREKGAGLVCMEMVSAKAIYYHNKNTEDLLKIHERKDRHPYSFLDLIRRSSVRWRGGSKTDHLPFWISTWAVRFQRS